MDDEDNAKEAETDLNQNYVQQYRRHLAEIQTLFLGRPDNNDLSPSFIPPSGYWSPAEKDLFFHGLGVYSRFRPDLIAGRIKTKTVFDVCAYIDALDAAASDVQTQMLRSKLGFALEVTDEWADWEEAQAATLTGIEPHWVIQGAQRMQPQAKGSPDDLGQGHEMPRTRAMALQKLEKEHLQIMDRLLRDEIQETEADESTTTWNALDNTIAQTLPEQLTATTNLLSSQSDILATLHHNGAQTSSSDSADMTVGGLASSNPTSLIPVDTCEFHPWGQSTKAGTAEGLMVFHEGPTASSQHLQTHSILARLPSNVSPGLPHDSDLQDPSVPLNLSPASRRRFLKRLYMRRKRAELTGGSLVTDNVKLKPGRKSKEKPPPRGRPEKYKPRELKRISRHIVTRRTKGGIPRSTQNFDPEGTKPLIPPTSNKKDADPMPSSPRETARCDSVSRTSEAGTTPPPDATLSSNTQGDKVYLFHGGQTKPYKIKSEFESLGIDADVLHAEDLDFFRLSALSRLMSSCRTHYGAGLSFGHAISADTLRLLRAIIVDFVTQLVHLAIVVREQEVKFKTHRNVWRLTHHEIGSDNVEHALQMIGLPPLERESANTGKRTEELDDGGQLDMDKEQDAQGGGFLEAVDTYSLPMLSPLSQELHPPFIHLPLSVSSCLLSDEDLMPAETDEEVLLDELQEEETLDELEYQHMRVQENELWQNIMNGSRGLG